MADIYDGILRTIIHDCKSFVLPLINEVFGENYKGDEKIVFHPNEHLMDNQDNPDNKRITDTSFSVEAGITKNYHFECESSKYARKILIRIFEYDAQIALDDYSELEGDSLKVSFPNTCIIYLRSIGTTPEYLTVIMETPGGSVSYKVPVIRMAAFDIEEIFEKRLYILIPYYIFNFEKDFNKYNTDEKYLESLREIYLRILEKLETLEQDGEITSFDKRTIIELTRDCIKELTQKYDNIQKGVGDTMSGALIETEARRILDTGIGQGIAQGISQGINIVAENMLRADKPYDEIIAMTGIPMENLKKLAEKIKGTTIV